MPGLGDHANVFFPWEKRRGLRSLFGPGRAGQALVAAVVLALFVVIAGRERRAADVRSTRRAITATIEAVSAFRADHDRACPAALADLVAGGYLHALPRDAWGRPLRVACPGRKDPRGFDVSSDGPDGQPGGLDRVE